MAFEKCEHCGRSHYATDPCRASIDAKRSSGGSSVVERSPSKQDVAGSKPARRSKKSTASPVLQTAEGVPKAALSVGAVDRAPEAHAVDTNPSVKLHADGRGLSDQLGQQGLARPVSPKFDIRSSTAGEGLSLSPKPAAVPSTSAGTVVDEDRQKTNAGIASSPSGKASVFGTDTAGSVPSEASTPKRGRPKLHADRKAYKAEKAKEYRLRKKAEAKP